MLRNVTASMAIAFLVVATTDCSRPHSEATVGPMTICGMLQNDVSVIWGTVTGWRAPVALPAWGRVQSSTATPVELTNIRVINGAAPTLNEIVIDGTVDDAGYVWSIPQVGLRDSSGSYISGYFMLAPTATSDFLANGVFQLTGDGGLRDNGWYRGGISTSDFLAQVQAPATLPYTGSCTALPTSTGSAPDAGFPSHDGG